MIRQAALEDVSRIAEILIFAKRSAYRDIFKNDKVSFGEMQVLPLALQYINNPALLENIIVFDDEFVKAMAATETSISADGSALLNVVEFFVDPFFQDDGIGKKMLREIEGRCKRDGIGRIALWVLAKNTRAIGFYEKHGFRPTGEQQLLEGTPEYIVRYAKEVQL